MVGKLPLSQDDINIIFHKLDPYLRTGISLNKSCLMADVPKSTVYDLYKENLQFAEKIDTSKNYLSITTSSIFYTEIERVKSLQLKNKTINKEDLRFIQWFALNHKSNYEEFGKEALDLADDRQTELAEEIVKLAKIIDDCSGINNEANL